jgi:uncharacterized protein (DUF362 family)
MARVFISDLSKGYSEALEQGFQYLSAEITIKPDSRVYIKPNLTFPTFRKGVMTSPEALEATVRYLKNFTNRVTICESDSGGYNRFSMDEVFRVTGILEMARRYGVSVINMSYAPSRAVAVQTRWRTLSVPIPELLLDEVDLFVTMPVPKMHANAIVSLAIKNQWGCIQEPRLRLKLHPYFKEVVYSINKIFPRCVAIMDGKYGLTQNGPMRGTAIDLNWILVANSVFWCDYFGLLLMGLDYRTVPYLRFIFEREKMSASDDVVVNTDYRLFKKEQFFLRREWTDYPGLSAFRSRCLAYVAYESPLASSLHWLLYRFREPFY